MSWLEHREHFHRQYLIPMTAKRYHRMLGNHLPPKNTQLLFDLPLALVRPQNTNSSNKLAGKKCIYLGFSYFKIGKLKYFFKNFKQKFHKK
jgi:hypothetical protein